MITVGDFIHKLFEVSKESADMDLDMARQKGLVEENDILSLCDELDRKTAARLIHCFLKIILREPDEADITPAYELKDLFDCRVCAGHIAQVYLKGIMDKADIEGICIFDGIEKVTAKETDSYIKRIKNRESRMGDCDE